MYVVEWFCRRMAEHGRATVNNGIRQKRMRNREREGRKKWRRRRREDEEKDKGYD